MIASAQNETDRDALIERGWAALPSGYRIPEVAPTLEQALAWCRHLAETHYENFHVASWFLPKALRPHFHAIYAYCRVSDDLGDEVGDTAQSLALLDLWGRELDACFTEGDGRGTRTDSIAADRRSRAAVRGGRDVQAARSGAREDPDHRADRGHRHLADWLIPARRSTSERRWSRSSI